MRLAYAGWEVGTAVAYIGVDAGLFKHHGLDVDELPIRDTLSAGVQSLLGVDLLIGFGNPLAVLQPVASGGDITVIGSHVSFDQYGMGVATSIDAIKDLKGKKVGVSALGARSDLIARVMLRRAGLDPPRTLRWWRPAWRATGAGVIEESRAGGPLWEDIRRKRRRPASRLSK